MSGSFWCSNRVLVIIFAFLSMHQEVVTGSFSHNNQTSRTSSSTAELVELARLNDFASPARGALAGKHLSIAMYAADFGRWMNYTGGWELYGQSIHLPPRTFRGFIPQMIDEIAKEVGFTYDLYPVWMSSESDSFDPVFLLTSGEVNVTLNYGMHPNDFGVNKIFGRFLFSPPIYDTSVSALVLKTSCRDTFWRFMDPFTPDLWASIGAGLVVSAALMVGIEHLNALQPAPARPSPADGPPPTLPARPACACGAVAQAPAGDHADGRGPSAGKGARFLRALYHATALYLQGDDREWRTVPERILRLSLLFVVLIMVASYTANLAAFFTQPSFKVHGPRSVAELRNLVACTANFPDEGDTLSVLWPYVDELISAPRDTCTGYWQSCAIQYCHEALKAGRADVWLDDKNALHQYMLEHGCSDLAEVPGISILPGVSSFSLLTKAADLSLSLALSAGALHLTRQPLYHDISNSIVRSDLSCDDAFNEATATTPISFSSMLGLFAVWAFLGCSATLAALVQAGMRLFGQGIEGCSQRPLEAAPDDSVPTFDARTAKHAEAKDDMDLDIGPEAVVAHHNVLGTVEETSI